MVIISLKCLILRETFVNLENGTKDEEFNHPRSLSVRKAGLLIVCDSTNHGTQLFELSGKFVTRFGSKGSERGELRLCFQVQQQISLMQRDIVTRITAQSP